MAGSRFDPTGPAEARGKCTVWMLDVDVLWKGPEEAGPFLHKTFDDRDEAVREACIATDVDRLSGVPNGMACVFLAYDAQGDYLGGDTYDLDRPQGKEA